MNSKIKLPKPYLSYSQVRLWLDDKSKYRIKYYAPSEDYRSPELDFGKKMAEGLEDGSIVVPGLELYPVKEHEFLGELGGVPFKAFLDQYWPEKVKFRETKTGKRDPLGRGGWDQGKVDRHIQLDIYSTAIEDQNGHVDDECHLDWILTRNKLHEFEFQGHKLIGPSREIELTGEVVVFRRIVSVSDRDRMRALIKSVALEIEEDYRRYLSLRP